MSFRASGSNVIAHLCSALDGIRQARSASSLQAPWNSTTTIDTACVFLLGVDLAVCKLRFTVVGDSRRTIRFRVDEGIGHTGYIVTGSGMDYARGACDAAERINAVPSQLSLAYARIDDSE